MSSPPDFLAKKNEHPRDKLITFDEGPHIYTIEGDSSFMSVTTWNHSHFPHFNANKIIDNMMKSKKWPQNKYYGKTKKEILDIWKKNGKEASEAGTKMHYDIECFYNNIFNENDSTEFKYFMNFHKSNDHLIPYRTEWMVWDKELKLAGSIDMVFENEEGSLDIYDWKRCKEIKDTNKWESATTECISYMPNANFWHYSLQLNTYKYMLEKNYGKKVRDLFLVCLHPNKKNYRKIRCPNLMNEIHALMKYRKDLLNNK